MASYDKLTPPTGGTPIRFENGQPVVPPDPIIPFIRGDGTGVDIWPATQRVLDAAVARAYGGARRIEWFKIYAGDEACELYGTYQYLPQDTLTAIETYGVAIKGPLTTPIGGGIRSLNVALRQIFDLYCCVRPCRYYAGTPSPHRRPQDLDVIVYRENTEDIYMGIEWDAEDPVGQELLRHINDVVIPASPKLGRKRIREGSAIGIKPVSKFGTQRHIRRAIQHALRLEGKRRHVTLVHKGNIMKFTEGAFRDWGYEVARTQFGATPIDKGPWHRIKTADGHELVVKDVIADAFLQQILTRPADYSVIATLNLNGDYISDALAACVGGIGIAPGANINYDSGVACFEATHGTAPKYAGLDKVNPGSLILSGEMMFRYMGWTEAADRILAGVERTISKKTVTYDFERLMEGATLLKCSEFGQAIADNM